MRVIGICELPGMEPIPVITMSSYLNTPLGWELYARCSAMGDMRPYRAAKAEWERRQQLEKAEGREITAEQLAAWRPADGEGLPVMQIRGQDQIGA